MSRRWFSLLLCLAVCLNSVPISAAAPSPLLRLNEADTKINFNSGGTSVTLTLENDAGRTIPARVRLEILDPQNRVRAAATRDESIRPGTNKLVAALAPSLTASLTNDQRRQLMLSRLRYRITPGAHEGTSPSPVAQSALPAAIEGYISLSQMIAPDVFELRVAAPQFARGGTDYHARARATHPLTARPVAGVSVAAEIKFEAGENDVTLKASGSTDAEGFAALAFVLPRRIAGNEGRIKVNAWHGDFRQEAEADIQLNNFANILVTTDKTLYQPGQELHMRALAFDATRRALANAPATLKITDPEGITVFRAPLQTSRFGVASADWPIPEGTRLGDYNLSIELGGAEYENSPQGYAAVRISRYELPNFVVNAKPDRVFYLPGQSAAVEVRADYLFGQPVTRGRVRVVREKERTWNYREQKWDIDEGEQHEGETDKNGRFTARLDFKEEFDDLLDDGDGEYAPRFRDLSYAAYFTDPTTNRTEQRRFDVRLTKEAIHIYVITGDGRQSSKLPLQFYVSTSYADGTPAADCEVQIRDEDEADADDETPGRLSAPVVRNVRTNKYGVAKVPGLRLQEQADEDDADLRLTARDGKGASGHRNENFDFWDRAIIRVETDKPFYRPGDPVKVRIEASEARMKVAVDVAREGRVIRSEMVQLHDGRASLVIPYTSDLKDEVAVSAYSLSEENFDRYDYPSAGRTILFPRDRDLKLDVELSRATYRPGEEALADFRVRAPDGRLIESALGVVVFDKAVEERARIDSDFSGGAGFSSLYRAWRGYGDTLAGVSRGELAKVDLKKPLPEGFDLVAEILLRESGYTPQLFGSDQFETNLSSVFNSLLTMQLNPLQSLLETSYAQQQIYPTNAEMLHRLLFPAGINFSDLRDPWGMPYRASFFVERETDVTAFICAGADKRFDTADDFTIARFARPYFRPLGEAINRAVARFNARTGQFVRDAATLKSELAREGIDLDAMRDPWGQPFQPGFGVNTKNYFINVRSGGPDQKIGNAETHDDVFVWNSSIDYTRLLKAEIDDALGRHFAATNNFPQTVAEFDDALARAGLNKGTLLRDGWDRPLYVTFRRDARYTDRVRIQSYASFGQPQQQKTEVTPITQHVNYLDLRSAGADGKEGTSDDFDIATFSRIVAEQTSKEQEPMPVAVQPISFSGMTGALIGTVTDPQGAVVPGATVEAKNNATAQIYKATSADDGKFYLRNLPIGMYQVTVSAAYFKNTIITDVPVKAGQFTPLDLTLDVGGVSETVTVMSSVAEATSTTTSHSLSAMQIEELPSNGRLPQNFFHLKPGASTTHGATSTPRLREYFPETLVWQPSVETDRQGRAQIRFKLADNITTWKMSVIGSTTDGEIGIAEREIQAFQPFFVEHDPPRVLTEGDEIALPVVVRNYLATPQQVALDIKPEDWFTMLGPTHKQMRVPAGDAVRETFDFRAIASVKEGKQRITAMAGDADDAIERGVHVHPDGAEIAHTAAGIFGDAAALAIDIPADALPNTARAELKIYPNLLAHVVESIEAIMSRPYGCGEQTISSAYPSLLVLRHYQRAGFAPDKLPPVALNAQRYLRLGYERLLSYRAADGGFSYWGRGDERADLALTAYAVRFLEDAKELIDVDADVLAAARGWLLKQQQPDGSWQADEWDQQQTLKPRTAMLTAYIARVLAKHKEQSGASRTSNASTNKPPDAAAVPSPLRRALHYLSRYVEQLDEPYLLASYALAAQDAGDTPANITKMLDKLRTLARDDGSGGAYWSLETNTPFYGWGRAGRIETTALAVQAFHKGMRAEGGGMNENKKSGNDLHPSSLIPHPLIERGLLFLLRNKDRYGVWLSTQATINVLDALVLLSNGRAAGQQKSGATEEAAVFVNDRRAGVIKLPLDDLNNPVTFDLSRFLSAGANRVEIKRAPGSPKAAAQVVGAYYLPWSKAQSDGRHHAAPEAANALRLAVKFDHTASTVGDEITCSVNAERIGFHGYGMLLGEIGLPPGADVDRASLEEAVKASGWTFSRYDVLPDRIVVYLWPRAGGTKFSFKFRPRFGLNAQTAASMLYDYYNPEARAVLAPTRFAVREKARPTPAN